MPETESEQHARLWRNWATIFLALSVAGFCIGVFLAIFTFGAAIAGTGTYGDAAQAMLAVSVFALSMVQLSLSKLKEWTSRVEAEERGRSMVL